MRSSGRLPEASRSSRPPAEASATRVVSTSSPTLTAGTLRGRVGDTGTEGVVARGAQAPSSRRSAAAPRLAERRAQRLAGALDGLLDIGIRVSGGHEAGLE